MDAARYTAAAVETATGTRPEIFAFGWMDYYPPNVRGQETALLCRANQLVFPFRRSIQAHSRLLVRVTAQDNLPTGLFLSAEDAALEYARPALWGAAGTIVWGASEDTFNNTQCNGPKSLVRRHSLLSA